MSNGDSLPLTAAEFSANGIETARSMIRVVLADDHPIVRDGLRKLLTLEDDIEPFLLRSGLIQRSSRGRVATARAFEHLGRKAPLQDPQSKQRPLFDEGAE